MKNMTKLPDSPHRASSSLGAFRQDFKDERTTSRWSVVVRFRFLTAWIVRANWELSLGDYEMIGKPNGIDGGHL
jgi:hypothetical protein